MTNRYAPIELDGGVVYRGDLLQVLPTLSAGSVDLVLGSPPYEKARLYLEDGVDLGIARDTEAWVAWMVDVFRASLRVSRGLVAYVVGHGKHGCRNWTGGPALLCADLLRAGVVLRNPPLYRRSGIPGSGADDWLRADYEWIICATNAAEKLPWSDNTACGRPPKFGAGGAMSNRGVDGSRVNALGVKRDGRAVGGRRANGRKKSQERQTHAASQGLPPAPRTWGELGTGGTAAAVGARPTKGPVPDLANPGNVIDCGAAGGGNQGSNIAHANEAPYPERLADFFVRSFCPPGGTVLDPYSGSGTTAAVCVKTGRRFIAVDLRPSQVALTRRRVQQAHAKKGFCL